MTLMEQVLRAARWRAKKFWESYEIIIFRKALSKSGNGFENVGRKNWVR